MDSRKADKSGDREPDTFYRFIDTSCFRVAFGFELSDFPKIILGVNMLKYDERFFKFCSAQYSKSKNTLRLVFLGDANYTLQIPKHEKSITRQVHSFLQTDIPIEFEYNQATAPVTTAKAQESLRALKEYADNLSELQQVDKTIELKAVQHWLGLRIKTRPLQIKYLRPSKWLQVTAGTIHFLKKREYKRTDANGTEVTKSYWTFVLDDRETRLQCVFFPTEQTYSKFDKLTDKTAVCIIGLYDKNKRGEFNFRVSGVSCAEF